MKSLLITRNLPDTVVARLRNTFDVTYRDRQDVPSVDGLVQSLQTYDAILPTLGDAYASDVFAQAGTVKTRMMANFGVGFNHIDVASAQAAGVSVTNTPGAVTDATADIALTLMLMTCRRAGEGERLVRSGQWGGWHPVQMLGLHMTGKALGIVGMGRIGQAIAKRAHFGFGMEIRYFNRSEKPLDFPAQRIEDLRALASQVDVLVTAVPGGGETKHIINTGVLSAMKPTAHFVNIARGDVVDEAALISALETGVIAGAGLDVYEQEPIVPEALRALENVVLLPHLGTAALEVRESMGHMAADNLEAWASGADLPNPV